jgi:hypothetical protein
MLIGDFFQRVPGHCASPNMHQFGGVVIVAKSRRGRMGSSTDVAFLEEITTSCGLQKGCRGTGSARGNECVYYLCSEFQNICIIAAPLIKLGFF